MRIEDHTSGCVAHIGVLAGKLCFLGKSRSNPLCIGEWVSCGCCLKRFNVVLGSYRTIGKGEIRMTLVSHMGEYFRKKLWFLSNGATKTVKKWEFPAGIAYCRIPSSGWFSPSHVDFRLSAA